MSSADAALCRAHTANAANQTWRPPSGALAYPYLVPAGPYTQLWDWDSVFLGCATLSWGSRAYLEGSMANFLAATNLTTGAATGCLTPTLPVACSSDPKDGDVLVHAKPIIVQGAWLAGGLCSSPRFPVRQGCRGPRRGSAARRRLCGQAPQEWPQWEERQQREVRASSPC